MVLEKTPDSPLDSKEIKSVNLKGNQPWTLIGRTDAETEALEFRSPDVNNWLIGKVPDAEKNWGQKEKSVSEDEVAGRITHAMHMNSGRWWGTGRPRVLQSMGSQRVRHNWADSKQHAFTVGWMKSSNCGKVNCVGVYRKIRPVSTQLSVHMCLFQHTCLFRILLVSTPCWSP